MYTGLTHFHSTFRYIILLLFLMSIVLAIAGLVGNKKFTGTHLKLAKFTVMSLHIQFLTGLILYFFYSNKVFFSDMAVTMGDPLRRFFTVEHIFGMLIAIVIATIGNKKIKTAKEDSKKFKRMLIYFIISLIIIFASIPWPFLKNFGSWI